MYIFLVREVRNKLYIVASWYVIEVGRGNSARGRDLDLEYNSFAERVHGGPRTNLYPRTSLESFVRLVLSSYKIAISPQADSSELGTQESNPPRFLRKTNPNFDRNLYSVYHSSQYQFGGG